MMVAKMAPTAPDTLLFTAGGILFGLVVYGLSEYGRSQEEGKDPEGYNHPNARPPAMDVQKLSSQKD